LLTPAIGHLPIGTVNTNANEGGIGSGNSVGPQPVTNFPETFRIDFVIDSRGDPADSGQLNYANPVNQDQVFDGHYTVNGATADFTSTTGSTVNIKTFDDPDGNTVVGDGTPDTITGVVILFGASSSGLIDLTQPLQPSYSVGGHAYTITEHADGSIDVGGVFGNNTGTTTIGVFTATGYNSVEYTWVADDTFKIGNFGAAVQSTDPVNFSVPVQVVDTDGDTASGNLNIDLLAGTGTQDHSGDLVGAPHTYTSTVAQPNIIGSAFADTLNGLNGTNDTLYGGLGDDILNAGTTGIDILIGGPGNNTLNGTTSASLTSHDEFVLQVSTGEHDIINNFNSTFDGILVDIGAGGTVASAMASSGIASNDIASGATTASAFNGTNHFGFNTATHELYYSADATAAHAIDLATISTGVQPTAASVHTF